MDPSATRARRLAGRAIAASIAVAAALSLALATGCGARGAKDPAVLRLGFFPNVTHVVPLVGKERGSFAAALAPVQIEWKAFASGPQAIEAIFADALDACYVGPGPAMNGHLRSHGAALVILAGASSGGAGFVVRRDAHIRRPEDLHGRTLATPQIGNTQDVALRAWLMEHDLDTRERGGDIRVLPIANPETLTLMKRGEIDGAWVPEPWIARLVAEAGGELFLDETSLWPDGRFPTTVLVATPGALAQKHAALAKLVGAHVDEVRWIEAHAGEARSLVADGVRHVNGKGLPPAVLAAAFARVRPTWDPMTPTLLRMAAQARALSYFPDGDLTKLVDRSLLDGALAARTPGEVAP